MVWIMLRSVTYCGYDVNISFVVGLRGCNFLISRAFGLFIACQRSQSCWSPSQKSADMPTTWDNRSAVSGVTDRRPLIISFNRGYETPNFSASSVWVMLRGLTNSSRSISPGCVGGRFAGSLLAIILVIICDFDFICMSLLPHKTDTVLLVYSDTELVFTISF
jgi:hypothetical protein